jgi:hypothetical protein
MRPSAWDALKATPLQLSDKAEASEPATVRGRYVKQGQRHDAAFGLGRACLRRQA